MENNPVPKHLRVFLASPGDVTDERGLAVRVLGNLPSDPLLRGKITVEAVAWDHPGTKTPFLAGMSAQDAVIHSLGKPSECDIMVVILWSRLGSPIKQEQFAKPDGTGYYSGTEWEYEDAWQAFDQHRKPPILLYYRRSHPNVELDPSKEQEFLERLERIKQVQKFLQDCHERDGSIPNEYQAPSEFEKSLENHLKELIREIIESEEPPQVPAAAPPAPRGEGSPFPGLRAFTDKDAPIFFGRGRETDDLILRFGDPANRFIAVVGASGSGKSSLVWAGLIPRLQAGAIEGSQDWVWIRFKPGDSGTDPYFALANQLATRLSD